jgi:aspartyl-tRNA(Asn)/glutamyl-tRNA(Gln) amidotransferase subunit C
MIDENLVRHIEKLARLSLSDEERKLYQGQLSSIVEYVGKLKELNLEGVAPLAHAAELFNIFRDDKKSPHLSQEEVLKNTPQQMYGFFSVPKIIETQE